MISNKIKAGLSVLGIILWMGCSSNTPFEPGNDNQSSNVTRSKFSEIQKNVFNTSCALSGCHAGSNPKQGMSLEAGKAFGQLVNVNSKESPAMKRVKPGDSANSWIIKKLRANGTSVMPPAGMLASTTIDSIAKWIDRGAQND